MGIQSFNHKRQKSPCLLCYLCLHCADGGFTPPWTDSIFSVWTPPAPHYLIEEVQAFYCSFCWASGSVAFICLTYVTWPWQEDLCFTFHCQWEKNSEQHGKPLKQAKIRQAHVILHKGNGGKKKQRSSSWHMDISARKKTRRNGKKTKKERDLYAITFPSPFIQRATCTF